MVKMVEDYTCLPEIFREQLDAVACHFRKHPEVDRRYKLLLQKYPNAGSTVKEALFALSIKGAISPRDMMKPRWFEDVYCYTRAGDRLYLKKVIVKGDHVCVMQGVYKKRPVVVKWYQSKSRDASYEIDIYKRMRSIGAKVPWFSSHWWFWGHRVLVMEKLENLGSQDDPIKIGCDVLDQLRYLHTFGIHCDLKPGNIMRSSCGRHYYIIDYGGVAIEPLDDGYRRWIWSPKWTCRKSHEKGQVATPYDDFRELAHTIKAIQLWRSADKTIELTRNDVLSDYKGRLKRYKRQVKAYGRQPPEEAYECLAEIIKGH